MFCDRTSGDKQHRFLWANYLPATQPTVPEHCRKLNKYLIMPTDQCNAASCPNDRLPCTELMWLWFTGFYRLLNLALNVEHDQQFIVVNY